MSVRKTFAFASIACLSCFTTLIGLHLVAMDVQAATGHPGDSWLGALQQSVAALFLSTPSVNAVVAGTVSLAAWADAPGVASLQFAANGTSLGPPITSGTCAMNWDTSMWSNGTYTLQADGADAVGNPIVSPPVTVTVLNGTPQVFNVGVSDLTASTVTLTWTTSPATEGLVVYGPTTGYGSASTLEPALETGHGVALGHLQPLTTYHFSVEAWNALGAEASTGDFVFTTSGGGGGTEGGGTEPSGTAPSSGEIYHIQTIGPQAAPIPGATTPSTLPSSSAPPAGHSGSSAMIAPPKKTTAPSTSTSPSSGATRPSDPATRSSGPTSPATSGPPASGSNGSGSSGRSTSADDSTRPPCANGRSEDRTCGRGGGG